MIFVDEANVYYGLLKFDLKKRIDYVKFKEIMAKGCHLVGAEIFMGKLHKVLDEQQKFYDYLKSAGYNIHFRKVQKAKSGKRKQKGIDILMYKEIIEWAERDAYDKCILVSGDGDFTVVVEKLKDLHKSVVIWSFMPSLSQDLIDMAGRENIFFIEPILNDIEYLPEN
ncbi:MAG: NYN domain-containing protein [Candidatus Odinarchaeota archaeon]